jgi:hypothetical protein
MLRTIPKYRGLPRSALVLSLVLLFWAAQMLPALAGPGFCQMKAVVDHQGHPSAASHRSHSCCCGHADSHSGLKGQCCDVREAERSARPDLAVSLVPNLPTPNPIGLVAESRCGKDLDPFMGATRSFDWVQSKSLSKPIYLNNLKFLC